MLREDPKARFERKFERAGGCWVWLGAFGVNGYGHFWYKGSPVPAHRVSFQLYRGEIPDSLCVLHRCDNRACVNPEHLFLGTSKENTEDMVAKNRQAKGSRLHNAKLTETQIEAIRADRRSQRKIGADLGVSHTVIWQIKAGTHWKHV